MNGSAMMAKGSTVRSTLDFLRDARGAEGLARVLAAIDPTARQLVEHAGATGEIDYDLLVTLWQAADAELGAADPQWMERAGGFSIARGGTAMYGGILRKKDPGEFLTQSISLFRLYYHPGDMTVVAHDGNRAVLRLVGFDARTPLFCRRQTGGLTKALEIAGGDQPVVRHVRCALEGDAYCEWELTWQGPERPMRDTPSRVIAPV